MSGIWIPRYRFFCNSAPPPLWSKVIFWLTPSSVKAALWQIFIAAMSCTKGIKNYTWHTYNPCYHHSHCMCLTSWFRLSFKSYFYESSSAFFCKHAQQNDFFQSIYFCWHFVLICTAKKTCLLNQILAMKAVLIIALLSLFPMIGLCQGLAG